MQEYVKELEKREREEKAKEEAEKKRGERRNRDAFKDLLRKHKCVPTGVVQGCRRACWRA